MIEQSRTYANSLSIWGNIEPINVRTVEGQECHHLSPPCCHPGLDARQYVLTKDDLILFQGEFLHVWQESVCELSGFVPDPGRCADVLGLQPSDDDLIPGALQRLALPLRLQQPTSPQRPLQCGLHLHVLELGDGEVEVLDSGVALVGVVVEEQLGEMGAGQG